MRFAFQPKEKFRSTWMFSAVLAGFYAASALSLTGCPRHVACPAGVGTLVFQNESPGSVFVSVADEEGEFQDLILGAQSEHEEIMLPGSYSVVATSQASGRVLLDQTYELGCQERVEVRISPFPQLALTVMVTGSGQGWITSTPTGIDCASMESCSAEFDVGTEVALRAAAGAGSRFLGWSGACSGDAVECVVTLDQSRNVGAQFVPLSDSFMVTLAGTGRGQVTSNPVGIDCSNDPSIPATNCSTSFDRGTTVVLTAVPSLGSEFAGWSEGGCEGFDPVCTTSIAGAANVTARFVILRETLTVVKTGSGQGTVSASSGGLNCGAVCLADYDYGTTLALTAVADPGSHFAGWSGACSGADPVCWVEITAAATAIAQFNVTQLTAPAVLSVDIGQLAQGQIQALGMNYYIATTGIFPPREGSPNNTGSPYIGQIMLFAGNVTPNGWLPCDGRLLSIASNTALFSILGTTYGGDGRTTFGLPDLRARAPMSPGMIANASIPASGPGTSVVPVVDSISHGGVQQGQIQAQGIHFYISITGVFPPREGAINTTGAYFGQIMMFAGNFAPPGFLPCDGRLLSIASNTALFSLLGTNYGGDGRTTFALPDFRSRAPMGAGATPTPWTPPTSSTQIPLIQSMGWGEVHQGQAGVQGMTYAIATEGVFPSASGPINTSGPYLGQLLMFAGNFAPGGYRSCEGESLSIATHSALFEVLRTSYGGNGTTHFSLPDLRARVPTGAGSR